jgi:hypothetical protein
MLSNAFHKVMRKPLYILIAVVMINVIFAALFGSIVQYNVSGDDQDDSGVLIETRRLEDLVIRNARFNGRKMAELTCLMIDLNTKNSQQMNTHQTGGFCLPFDDAKKLATHYPFDTKLATGIADNCFLWSNLTVTDMGAGPGHYGKFWLYKSKIAGYRAFDAAGNVEPVSGGIVDWTDLTEDLEQQWTILEDQSLKSGSGSGSGIGSRFYHQDDRIKSYFWTSLDQRPSDKTQAYLQRSDWVVSLEVLEHVPPHKEKVVVENLLKMTNNAIILSWAIPKQGGVSHINEKPNEYVIDLFVKKMGLYHCKSVGDTLRVQSQLAWFRNTIFVFAKNEIYRGFTCK